MKVGQVLWDGKIPGLGVRRGESRLTWRLKVPVARAGIRYATKAGEERVKKFVVETLNPVEEMTLAEARNRATELKGEITKEVGDPVAMHRRAKASEITLRAAWDRYVAKCKVSRLDRHGREIKKPCSPVTIQDYESSLRLYFSDWESRTLASLSREREAFEARFNDLTSTRGPRAANKAVTHFKTVWGYAESKTPELKALGCPADVIGRGELNPEEERKIPYQPEELPSAVKGVWRAGRFRAGVHLFMFLSGCRSGGVKKALRSDYDREAGTLLLREHKGSETLVPLSPTMTDLIDSMITLGDRHFKGTKYIFPANSKAGHLVDVRIDAPAPAALVAHRAKIRLGVDAELSGHQWRHTWRSLYPLAGLSRHDGAMMIGHEVGGKQTAHDGYAAPIISHLRGQQAIMSDYLMKAAGFAPDFRFTPSYFLGVRELDALEGLI